MIELHLIRDYYQCKNFKVRNEIVKQALPTIRNIAKKVSKHISRKYNVCFDIDDFFQQAVLFFIEGLEKIDIKKADYQILTFLLSTTRYSLLKYFYKEIWKHQTISLNELKSTYNDNLEQTLFDSITDTKIIDEVEQRIINKIRLEKLLFILLNKVRAKKELKQLFIDYLLGMGIKKIQKFTSNKYSYGYIKKMFFIIKRDIKHYLKLTKEL